MKLFSIAVAALLMFGASQALATITADELLKRCKGEAQNINKNDGGESYCVGYIAGFLDTYMLVIAIHDVKHNKKYFCLPKSGISLQRAKQVTDNYFENHHKDLNRPARVVLVKAFANAYPCSQ